MKTAKIPEVTIMRLTTYSRYLLQLKESGKKITSSREIAEITGSTSAQVRKDFAYFGEFGVRGVGYDVDKLYEAISNIIGLHRNWQVAIIGAGHLGGALLAYSGFGDRGFHTAAIFDADPSKVGTEIDGLKVADITDFEKITAKEKIDIAVIVVPADKAQKVGDMVVASGIKAILNFAPVVLSAPTDVEVRNVDLSTYLEILSYNMLVKGL